MARQASETTLKVRAFGKVERLNAEIRKMQDAEMDRRAKYEAQLLRLLQERDEAQADYNKFLEGEIAAAKGQKP
jgi:hypothetical protein